MKCTSRGAAESEGLSALTMVRSQAPVPPPPSPKPADPVRDSTYPYFKCWPNPGHQDVAASNQLAAQARCFVRVQVLGCGRIMAKRGDSLGAVELVAAKQWAEDDVDPIPPDAACQTLAYHALAKRCPICLKV